MIALNLSWPAKKNDERDQLLTSVPDLYSYCATGLQRDRFRGKFYSDRGKLASGELSPYVSAQQVRFTDTGIS